MIFFGHIFEMVVVNGPKARKYDLFGHIFGMVVISGRRPEKKLVIFLGI